MSTVAVSANISSKKEYRTSERFLKVPKSDFGRLHGTSKFTENSENFLTAGVPEFGCSFDIAELAEIRKAFFLYS